MALIVFRRNDFSLLSVLVSRTKINTSCAFLDRNTAMLYGFVVCVAIASSYLLNPTAGWPAETYGLIAAATGCPGGSVNWYTGWRFFDSEDTGNKDDFWPRNIAHFLDVTIGNSGITLNFCMKETYSSTAVSSRPEWPKGSYCILKYDYCPAGYIHWHDESRNSNKLSGSLPNGSYTSETTIYFCCRNDTNYATPISLPSANPFVLLRRGGRCQDVMGMNITPAAIFWDNENTNNHDNSSGAIPDEDGGPHDHRLHFCHYASNGNSQGVVIG